MRIEFSEHFKDKFIPATLGIMFLPFTIFMGWIMHILGFFEPPRFNENTVYIEKGVTYLVSGMAHFWLPVFIILIIVATIKYIYENVSFSKND